MMEALLSVLGVAFFEAVRIYSCFSKGDKILPTINVPSRVSILIYVVIILIFMVVAALLGFFIQPKPEYSAIAMGAAVPLGTRLIPKSPEGDQVDDLWDEELKPPFSIICRIWLDEYHGKK